MTLTEYNELVASGVTTFNVYYVNTYSGLGSDRLFQRGTFQVAGDILFFADGSVIISPMETYDGWNAEAQKVIRGANGTQTVNATEAQQIVDAGYVEVLTYSIEAYDNGTASTNFTGVEIIEGGLSNTDFTGIELISGGVA